MNKAEDKIYDSSISTTSSSHPNDAVTMKYINQNYKGSSTSCIQPQEPASGYQKKQRTTTQPKQQQHRNQQQQQQIDNSHQHQKQPARKPKKYYQEECLPKDQEHYQQNKWQVNLSQKKQDQHVYFIKRKCEDQEPIVISTSNILETALPILNSRNFEQIIPKAKEIILALKSLFEMGFKAKDITDWENILQPLKENLYKLLKEMIDNHIKPNIQIRIGNVVFNCHMQVLQCYSEFFRDLDSVLFVRLPEEIISPEAFVMVYDWMIQEKPLVQRENILELFNAANFLRISQLIKQCWICLDDDVRFSEHSAFLLYLEARQYNLQNLEELMLMRIYKFFLTLVSSKEFVDLEAKEVIVLLNSNTIGVNTEIEIFMSAIRWLDFDWIERKQYVLDVMKTVRFSLMPPWYLVTLTKKTDCDRIDRILAFREVQNMINDSITYTTTKTYYGDNCDEFFSFIKRYKLAVPMQRQWIYDEHCNYHHHLKCQNTQNITYTNFLEYLSYVQEMGKDHWGKLKAANTTGDVQCCKLDKCRKPNQEPPAPVNNKTQDNPKQGTQYRKFMSSGHDNNGNHEVIKDNRMLLTARNNKNAKAICKMASHDSDGGHATEGDSDNDVKCQPTKSRRNQYHQREKSFDIIEENNNNTKISQNKKPASKNNKNNDIIKKNNPNKLLRHKSDTKLQRQPSLTTIMNQKKQQSNGINKHDNGNDNNHKDNNKNITSKRKNKNSNADTPRGKNDHLDSTSDSDCHDPENNGIDNVIKQPDNSEKIDARLHNDCTMSDGSSETNSDTEVTIWDRKNQQQQQKNLDQRKQQKPKELKRALTQIELSTPIEVNRITDGKILVIGGVDPYCLHCSKLTDQSQRQSQQQQQQLVHRQKSSRRLIDISKLQSERMSGGQTTTAQATTNDTMTTMTNVKSNATIINDPNNEVQQPGDHVLIYDSGGDDMNQVAWRRISRTPLGARHHHAAVLCNGIIYVIGGTRTAFGCTKKSVFERSVWSFNPDTLKWVFECALPESRRDFAVIPITEEAKCKRCKDLKEPHVLDIGFFIIGGEGTNGKALNSVWFYNIKRKQWLKKPPLNIGRYGLGAALVNNEIWVAGGMIDLNSKGDADGSQDQPMITDTIEIYSLKCPHQQLNEIGRDGKILPSINVIDKGCPHNNGRWSKLNLRLREPRVFGKLCKTENDDLYMIGGIGLDKSGKTTSSAAIDLFDIRQHEWRHVGNLRTARHGHDVAAISDNCIVIIGGVSTFENRTLKSVEVFCTRPMKPLKNLTELPFALSGCAIIALK